MKRDVDQEEMMMMMTMMITTMMVVAVKMVITVPVMVVLAENNEHLMPDGFLEPSIGASFRWLVLDQGLTRLQSSCQLGP